MATFTVFQSPTNEKMLPALQNLQKQQLIQIEDEDIVAGPHSLTIPLLGPVPCEQWLLLVLLLRAMARSAVRQQYIEGGSALLLRNGSSHSLSHSIT
jgi:hypothetical protein